MDWCDQGVSGSWGTFDDCLMRRTFWKTTHHGLQLFTDITTEAPNMGRPSSSPWEPLSELSLLCKLHRSVPCLDNMHKAAAHARFDRTLFSLFCFLCCFIFCWQLSRCCSSVRCNVSTHHQNTYALTLWKNEVAYGAHHVICVIRLMANAFWMHPDV